MTGDADWTLGPYSVRALIGVGGMAKVYRAYQPALSRDVAIKVLPTRDPQSGGPARPEFLELFKSEARLIASLSHPYIVPIHDFGVDNDWAYLVMELITHGSMRDEFVRARANGQRVNLLWALAILDQVATALDFAHSRGVAHRDVKPGNMLLRELNMVVLSDFGVAKMLADRSATMGSPVVMGTPQYMAPEQARPNVQVDGRCDIYSLGVVLFECATGRLPFLGPTGEAIMLQHIETPPPLPRSIDPSVPPNVERIILRALAKDPNARYTRAAEMAQDLRVAHAELAQTLIQVGALSVERPAGPTSPIPSAPSPHAPIAVRPVIAPTELIPCFRCGTANTPGSRFCIACGYDMASARATSDTFRAMTGRPLRCRLIFQNGPFAGRALMLHQGVTTVGRGPGNDLLLGDGSVSRMHARLSFGRGAWYIEDVGSSNGVWVNRKQVRRPVELRHGDLVRLGNVEAMFEVVT
jgi:serine/threonine protein kinase